MAVKDQVNADLKSALRSGDEPRKIALRQLLAAFRLAELEKRTAARQKKGPGDLSDAEIAELEQITLDEAEQIAVVQKEAKAYRESIADAERGGRADLVAENAAALALLDAYLPRQLAREEIVALAREAIAEAGATGPKQSGAVMKLLAPRVKGLADGRLVNDIVRELLSPP
jgi:uncharacterized protein YqeY